MHIINNEKLIKTRSTWASRLMLAGFGLILGSAVLTFLNPTKPEYVLPAYAALIGGFIIFNMGALLDAKWRLPPRPDQALAKSLKGLDQRYRLYNYLLPADHVLLTPMGLTIFQVRRLGGVISCAGSKWMHKKSLLSRLRFAAEEQVGNPTQDAETDVAAVRQFLDKYVDDADLIPVDAAILFSHPLVQLTVTEPTLPVLQDKDLKDYVRQADAQGTVLDQDTWDMLADLCDEIEGGEEASLPEETQPAERATRKRKAKKQP